MPSAARIVDPRAIPVVGMDGHLPAVAAGRLDAHSLREHFRTRPAWTPEWAGDGLRQTTPADTAASVLVPLVMREAGLQVLLTRRTDHLRDHAGQISFPGGRAEPTDLDEVDTALRETEEEVGLSRNLVEVIGQLPMYVTVTGYKVTPVVGLVQPDFSLALDKFEVAEAFEVPLSFLMTPAHHRRHAVQVAGQSREFLSMPWQGSDRSGAGREYYIWGATAAMLRNLYRFLSL